MSVHYKFKSALKYDTVKFDGLHISVGELRRAIIDQKKLAKATDFKLQITDAQTKEVYSDDATLIPKNTSLIVSRIPVLTKERRHGNSNHANADDMHMHVSLNEPIHQSLPSTLDLTTVEGSEEDKIKAMMAQSTSDYDPSKYLKIRGANQHGPVPNTYVCHKCKRSGHWIRSCPFADIETKRSTGIPRSFLVPVADPRTPGALLTPVGDYAVPLLEYNAYKEVKKEKPPFVPEDVVQKEEVKLPPELTCSLCKDLLRDAVCIPCCGVSFCDECIRSFLLDSDDHECPECHETGISPTTLIPNRFLRNAVINYKNHLSEEPDSQEDKMRNSTTTSENTKKDVFLDTEPKKEVPYLEVKDREDEIGSTTDEPQEKPKVQQKVEKSPVKESSLEKPVELDSVHVEKPDDLDTIYETSEPPPPGIASYEPPPPGISTFLPIITSSGYSTPVTSVAHLHSSNVSSPQSAYSIPTTSSIPPMHLPPPALAPPTYPYPSLVPFHVPYPQVPLGAYPPHGPPPLSLPPMPIHRDRDLLLQRYHAESSHRRHEYRSHTSSSSSRYRHHGRTDIDPGSDPVRAFEELLRNQQERDSKLRREKEEEEARRRARYDSVRLYRDYERYSRDYERYYQRSRDREKSPSPYPRHAEHRVHSRSPYYRNHSPLQPPRRTRSRSPILPPTQFSLNPQEPENLFCSRPSKTPEFTYYSRPDGSDRDAIDSTSDEEKNLKRKSKHKKKKKKERRNLEPQENSVGEKTKEMAKEEHPVEADTTVQESKRKHHQGESPKGKKKKKKEQKKKKRGKEDSKCSASQKEEEKLKKKKKRKEEKKKRRKKRQSSSSDSSLDLDSE